jgi:hypothetical protein
MMYLSVIKFLVPYLIGGLIVGGATWKIQGMRLDRAKLNLEQSQSQVVACQDANKSGQATIGALKKEIANAQSVCAVRLKVKENTIRTMKEIDDIKPKKVNNEKDSNVATGDVILDMLNSMFDNTGTGN